MPDKPLDDVRLYAWVGEDECGSGKIGLKQAIVPAGVIPIVAVDLEKVDRGFIVDQMQRQVDEYGKTIYLVEYGPVRIVKTLTQM
jgi:hypothetical protein